MRIGSIDYSSKATKLIAALMVCVLVFMLAIPAQPADAAAGVALAAGLTLVFVAACGVAFTVNEAQNSSTYWEGQIETYLDESGMSDVGEWVDFGSVVYDSASGKLRYPGAVLSGLLDFFNWFTGKNSITAGGSATISSSICSIDKYTFGTYTDSSTFTLGTLIASPAMGPVDVSFTDGVNKFRVVTRDSSYAIDGYTNVGGPGFLCVDISLAFDSSGNPGFLIRTDCSRHDDSLVNYGTYSTFCAFQSSNSYVIADYDHVLVNYNATASDVVGLPDLEEKETELGYVPDINIPLPETVAEDTNTGDINDAADAVLDYAGTAGNTLDLEYEYVEDTNVDTGTDTETGEGTGTDAETGTQTGSLTLENVAADSLVEVAPETMLQDDTLMGLFISKFPWCIPFDLYFAISAFAADPVAPEFEVNLFEGVSWEGLDLSGTEMTLSFEAFEKVAAVTRWSTLIVFCAGLAMITKRMIWS